MNYFEHIGRAIEYIEDNLKTGLTIANAARASGYSEYHFLRVFKQVTHLTPADYIRKRRLSEIAREIDEGGRAVSDVAFEYGFNSKENFTRAFKTEHNILPTEYKSAGNSLKLFNRFQLEVPSFEVTPKIVTIYGFALTGFYNNGEYIPKFWNIYNCKKLSLRLSGGKTVADYGVSWWNGEQKRVDYFIGTKTTDANGDITGTGNLDIPGGLYAVFATPPTSHFDFVNAIHRTWNYILNEWLPRSEYRFTRGCKYQFETYIEQSRTYSENIYVPIEGK